MAGALPDWNPHRDRTPSGAVPHNFLRFLGIRPKKIECFAVRFFGIKRVLTPISATAQDQSGKYDLMDAQIEDKYENKIQAPFTDCLTGLFNHGILQLFLDREISRFHRYGTPFTLGLIDVDSFCGYNNRHGALQADRMLKEIGGAIKANIRRVDIAARFAGDNFAVILTGSDAGPDLKAAERIRNCVEELARGELTVSLGLAAFPRDAAEKNDLIRRAVEAVKEAKIRGKNQVFCFIQEKEAVHDSHPRILIVDDAPRNLKLLEALLVTKQ